MSFAGPVSGDVRNALGLPLWLTGPWKRPAREVEQYGRSLREDSYGRRNRQAIAASETRVAARLRAVEHAYRTATDPDAAPEVDRTRAPRSAAMAAERELELG